MAKFKIGDLVQLKSGGPKMTVNEILEPKGDIFRCAWFIGQERKEAEFSPDALQQWQEPDKTQSANPPSPRGKGFNWG